MLHYKGKFDTQEIDLVCVEEAYRVLKSEQEAKSVGYYDLPQSSLVLCDDISTSLLEESAFIETIAVVGIGGSTLGIKAIDRLLRSKTTDAKKIVYFENSDPISIAQETALIDYEKTLFIVISKSGGTVETLSIFKHLIATFNISLQDSKKVLVVSDDDSILSQFADHYGIKRFGIPSNVGGRFSVLSAVGVLPLLLAGFDVAKILRGAQSFGERFWERKEDHLLHKAAFYVSNAKNHPINVLFSYSDRFEEFGKWVVQLWGESLGKKNQAGERVGLTPISLIGSVDQHSFLQLIIEGPLNKTVTFMSVERSNESLMIPEINLPFLEKSDFVNGKSFDTLINAQCHATMQSVEQSGVNVDEIIWESVDEASVGEMIFYYELLTSASGALFEVNTYNQPGVELGKQILQSYFQR
jgi:glucose-6-phosphate isomerase